jgi:hypothetical protein
MAGGKGSEKGVKEGGAKIERSFYFAGILAALP